MRLLCVRYTRAKRLPPSDTCHRSYLALRFASEATMDIWFEVADLKSTQMARDCRFLTRRLHTLVYDRVGILEEARVRFLAL